MEKIPMTAAGYSTLEAELKHCQQVERPRIIQQITEARTHGDLSENAEYHAAKEQQSINEGRIAELEDKLARADVIDVSKLSGDTIILYANRFKLEEIEDGTFSSGRFGVFVNADAPGNFTYSVDELSFWNFD